MFFRSAQKRKTNLNEDKEHSKNQKQVQENKKFVLNQMKKQLIGYIKNKLIIKQSSQGALSLKQQTIQKVIKDSQSFDQIISSFVEFVQKMNNSQDKPSLTSIDKTNIGNPQQFYQKFQQEYMNLVQQNLKIKYEMSQNYERNIFKIKQLESMIEKLENENFSLKNKLQKKSNKCLILELQKNKIAENEKNRRNFYSPSYKTQNENNLKTNRSKSPFDFKPCIKLWSKQGIHSDRIKDILD